MISRSGNKGFLAAHWEWLVLAAGLAALAAGVLFYLSSVGGDADAAVAEATANIARMKPAETGVKGVDMGAYQGTMRLVKSPLTVAEVSDRNESFLASERMVSCKKCRKAISPERDAVRNAEGEKSVICHFCGEKQDEEKKVVLDADGDGLPDEWERKFGLNPSDAADASADSDGDGFTNAEEFAAKTDPTDRKDHPDYLDSLKLVLPLKETRMPFAFRKASKIPAGWRCEFFDPVRKDDYGRRGTTVTAVVGEPIGDYGFTLKSYAEKTEKRAIKGSELTKNVDVSEAVVERKRDGKTVTLVVQHGNPVRLAPVDVQATLVYERGSVQNLEVVPGVEIDLNGSKYRISGIQAVGKGAKVSIEAVPSGKKHVLEALEQ